MQRRPTVGPGSQKVTLVTLVSHSQPLWRGVTQGGVAPVFPFMLVLVFFINPIGASELTRGVSSSNLGTNPSTTPFFERGHRLNSSRWLYRTPPTLVGRLQLTPA